MGDEVADEATAPLEDPMKEGQGPKKALAVGIDLGTTYSCVGVYKDGNVEIIANDQGNRTEPSYVAWTDKGRLLGDAAKNQVANNPTNTVFDAKRLIGRKFHDPVVQADIKLWPFRVVDDGQDKPSIEVTYQGVVKRFRPEEISSMILTKMKKTAEAYLGYRITNAVVTVPAYFNDSQRQATKDAGEIAGLCVDRIVNEPTAAAIAYGLDKDKKGSVEKNVLIFDMGGGTFDVSILRITDTVFEVLATAGDPHLGGEDFDNRLLSHCISMFRRNNPRAGDPSRNQRALRRLRTQCERAKRTLSSATQATIDVDSLHEGVDFNIRISRAKFVELCMDYFKNAMIPVAKCLADSGLPKSKIHDVVLVGGSTRIPEVQDMIKRYFNGKELCKSINPDEAVAWGAAVQAAIVSGQGQQDVQNMLLIDVAPLSLGLETAGGMMQTLIERNSTIPTKKSQDFTTTDDYQTHVVINVYEGERAMVKDNNFLGSFTLTGILKTLRGVPKIEVSFNLDANGILEVSAIDRKSGLDKKITITNEKGRLSQAEIERMLADAATHKDEDDERKGGIIALESLKTYIARTQRAINDLEEAKLSAKERQSLEAKLKEATQWIEETANPEKEECIKRQRDVELAMSSIMVRINKASDDFWDGSVELPAGAQYVAKGGWHLDTGLDLRELIEDPD